MDSRAHFNCFIDNCFMGIWCMVKSSLDGCVLDSCSQDRYHLTLTKIRSEVPEKLLFGQMLHGQMSPGQMANRQMLLGQVSNGQILTGFGQSWMTWSNQQLLRYGYLDKRHLNKCHRDKSRRDKCYKDKCLDTIFFIGPKKLASKLIWKSLFKASKVRSFTG